jgi:hypothetical protein
MAEYVTVVNGQEGHGLNQVKTHSVLHVVPDDVLWFGSPNNWNSACECRGHKFHAKAPAKLMVQLQIDRLKDHISEQTTNILALNMASDLIWNLKNYLSTKNNIQCKQQCQKVLKIWNK